MRITDDVSIGVVGKIIEGRHKDWYIYVEDDSDNTGGYLILVFNRSTPSTITEGYDRWAENKSDLNEMFESARNCGRSL